MSEQQQEVLNREDDFVSLTGFAQFENEGDKVVGEYAGYMPGFDTSNDGKTTKVFQHMFVTNDGIVKINETTQTAILRGIKPGTEVMIVYLGEAKTNSGFRVKRFDVKVRRSIMLEATGAIVEAQRMGLLNAAPVVDEVDPFVDNDVQPAIAAV